MTASLELVSSIMQQKLRLLMSIASECEKAGVTYYYSELAKQILRFEIEADSIMSAYYEAYAVASIDNSRSAKNENACTSLNHYMAMLTRDNYIFIFDNHVAKLRRGLKRISPAIVTKIEALIAQYIECTITCRQPDIIKMTCPDCYGPLTYVSSSSELVCERPQCGFVRTIFGLSNEEEIDSGKMPVRRNKRGSYDPMKQRRLWLERIQAKESIDIDPEILENIKSYSRDDNLYGTKLTCAHIRNYLRIIKATHLNDHVPYIRKLVTGISPPQFTDHEMQLINNYSDKSVRVFEDIKPPNKTYCPYHPTFLYKIIEQVLISCHSNEIRKREILSCIHLQSRETLIANDRIWKQICARITGLMYRPTDRNEYQ